MNYFANLKYPETLREINSRLTGWLILFTCFGYPIQVLMVLMVGADSTPVNLSFRLGYLIISGYLFCYGFFRLFGHINLKSLLSVKLNRDYYPSGWSSLYRLLPWAALLLFWFIYGTRLVYDLEYKEWMFKGYHKFYVYAWAFGSSMMPAMAILMNIGAVDGKWLSRKALFFIFLSNIVIVLILLYISVNDISGIFGKRSAIMLAGDVKLKGMELLNSITISFYGVLAALTALIWFVFHQHRLSVSMTLFLVIYFLTGIFNLIAGASRGPLLDLVLISSAILVLSLFIYVKRLWRYINLRRRHSGNSDETSCNDAILGKSLLHKFLMTLLAVFILITIMNGAAKRFNINLRDLAFSERLIKLTDESMAGSADIRIDVWKSAWRQFTVNPIFGDSIINDVGYFYSHNIFMDSLMSVGIVGTIPFLIWFFLSFWYFIRLPACRKREFSVLFVAYLAALLLSMTSGGLFTVPEVWILSAAVIGLSQQNLKPAN